MSNTTIYERIRALRIERGLSQEELARKLGYAGRGTISKVELGERDISQSMIPKYADALGVTPAYIIFGEEALNGEKDPLGDDFKLTEPEKTLLRKVQRLDEIDKAKTEGFVDALLMDEKYQVKAKEA